MTEKMLGKISRIKLGYGGYQDVMFGLSITLEGKGWGTNDFKGWWGTNTVPGKDTKWIENDRSEEFDKVMRFINQLLIEAKKQSLQELTGVPIEAYFEDNTLKNWRVLTEVI